MKSIKYLWLLAALAVAGCAGFSTNLFRSEQTAVNLAYTAYVGYTNALHTGVLTVSVDQSNAVKSARIKLATSVSVLDAYRVSYETNADVKPYAQAALVALQSNASNFVWLVNYVRHK